MRKLCILVTLLVLTIGLLACAAPTPTKPGAPALEETPAPTPTLTPTSIPTVGMGAIEIRVTDPPPADVKSAVVYLKNIEAHKVNGEEGEWITIIDVPPSFDLLDVVGVEEALGAVKTQPGSFTQIQMDVIRVEVVTTEGEELTATVPGDKLKIVRPFNVEGGVTTILTLDFDGDKCVVFAGKKKVIFKPVVKLLIRKEKKLED